jgi:hypothetical protein
MAKAKMGTKARIKGGAIISLPSFISAKEATKDEMSEGVPQAPRACPEPVEGRPITSLPSSQRQICCQGLNYHD